MHFIQVNLNSLNKYIILLIKVPHPNTIFMDLYARKRTFFKLVDSGENREAMENLI